MRKSLAFFVCTLLVCVLAFAGTAYAGKPAAPVFVTLEQVQGLIADAVAGLQAQIDALQLSIDTIVARVGVTEERVTSLTERTDSLENSRELVGSKITAMDTVQTGQTMEIATLDSRVTSLEAASGGGDSDLTFTVGEPVVQDPYGVGPVILLDIGYYTLSLQPPQVFVQFGDREPVPVKPDHAYWVMRADGRELPNGDPADMPTWFAGPVADAPTEGAPFEFEYWYEVWGQQLHGIKTTASGWEYVRN